MVKNPRNTETNLQTGTQPTVKNSVSLPAKMPSAMTSSYQPPQQPHQAVAMQQVRHPQQPGPQIMTSYAHAVNQHQLAAMINQQRMTLQQRMPAANQRLQNPQLANQRLQNPQLANQQPRMLTFQHNPLPMKIQGAPPPQRQVNPPQRPRMTVTPPQQQQQRPHGNMVATQQQGGQQMAPQRKLPTVKQELEVLQVII